MCVAVTVHWVDDAVRLAGRSFEVAQSDSYGASRWPGRYALGLGTQLASPGLGRCVFASVHRTPGAQRCCEFDLVKIDGIDSVIAGAAPDFHGSCLHARIDWAGIIGYERVWPLLQVPLRCNVDIQFGQ